VHLRISLPTPPKKKEALLAARSFHDEVVGLPAVARGPLDGEHTRLDGRMYFDVVAENAELVENAANARGAEVEVVMPASKVSECLNCGNTAEAESTVCPNCQFRDISPCPSCGHEIPRATYVSVGGDLHQCPNCRQRVRLVFNDPLWREDGSYNEPVVRVLPGVP
jgi:hypothetical protein